MKQINSKTVFSIKPHRGRVTLIVLGLLLLLFSINVGYAYAGTVTLNDQAHVLNPEKVQSEAEKLPDSLLIYTTRTFTGDQSALDNDAIRRIPDSHALVIEVDTVQRHLSIQSGNQANLSNDQASNGVSTFKENFNNGDYTGATIATIDALNTSLRGGKSGGGLTIVGLIVALVLIAIFIVVIALLIVSLSRNRRRGGPPTGGRRGDGGVNNHSLYPAYINNSVADKPVGGNYGGGAGGSFGGGFGGGGGGAGGSF